MFCIKCGKELSENSKFCIYCGAPTERNVSENFVNNGNQENDNKMMKVSEPSQRGFSDGTLFEKTMSSDGLNYSEKWNIRDIYFIDFLCRLFKKENIPLCIYLVLNIFIIGGIMSVIFSLPAGWGLLTGLLLYIATVAIAISPIGEFAIRIQNGCRPIKDEAVLERLEPLFWEVYSKARQKDPSISEDVKLFINKDECPNAFATGRRTICITKGLLNYPDAQIRATLAHEFGHLAHKDTDRILVIAVGNTFIAGICALLEIMALIAKLIMSLIALMTGDRAHFAMFILGAISSLIMYGIVRTFNTLWTKLGVLLCLKTSRDNEYLADAFSYSLGYGYELCQLLDSFGEGKPKGLFAALASSHPANEDRIDHLLEMAQ